MKHSLKLFLIAVGMLSGLYKHGGVAQIIPQADTLAQQQVPPDTTVFSGSLGLTNNGFSIIPSFSLNSPALLVQLSYRRNRFSIDPDIRLTPNGKRGAMLFWFRYYPIQKSHFSLRVGAHPSFLLQTREIVEKGLTQEITQMRRFLAWELVPYYQVNKHWGFGLYYLQGNGLQPDGPQTTHFVNLNTSISHIRLGGKFRLKLIPAVYYLNLDGYSGTYFTATVIASHTKLPISLQSIVNQTFQSNLPGNVDFLWNASIHYHFSSKLVSTK
ncbi:MAG: hypothetical protein D6730_19275 [Bacteroidetes bacterium]|nr:MAG: hypothetical protein D6730_19275 [Bacteroidota bacterium]